jgi:hypothetical protein
MRRSVWAVVIVLAACGSKATTGGVDARFDASGSGSADAPASSSVVACGSPTQPTTCALPDMACCDFAPGTGTDYCYALHGGVPCEGGEPITCDGPEDCGTGDTCCYTSTAGSSCVATSSCAPTGEIMCHVGDDSPCGTNGRCCALHSGGPAAGGVFGTCRVGSCPV